MNGVVEVEGVANEATMEEGDEKTPAGTMDALT